MRQTRISKWRSWVRMTVMRRSRKVRFKWRRRTKWHRTRWLSLKSLEFCCRWTGQEGCIRQLASPGALSVVPLKTLREKSPCQGHSSAGHLHGFPRGGYSAPSSPKTVLSHPPLSLHPWSALPLQLSSHLPPSSSLLCLNQSYCRLFMMTTFYNWYNP